VSLEGVRDLGEREASVAPPDTEGRRPVLERTAAAGPAPDDLGCELEPAGGDVTAHTGRLSNGCYIAQSSNPWGAP